jgi:hypothetical protein
VLIGLLLIAMGAFLASAVWAVIALAVTGK